MIDWITNLLNAHIEYLPILSFSLLILAGFNVPISEDLVVILAGLIASTYQDVINPYGLYLFIYLGAYLGDFVSYFLGYYLGDKIFTQRPFNRWIHPKHLERISTYINRYGIITLLVGRFIPFGVRNTLFLTCGLSKMKFSHFALTDALAAFLSTSISFFLTYRFGYIVFEWVKDFQKVLLFIVLSLVFGLIIWRVIKKKIRS
jgi:membrane protein DedA with SNARE-associated domain